MEMSLRIWNTIFIIAAMLDVAVCQRIPLRTNDPSQLDLSDAELYVGSKMLPDGVEIVSYLKRYVASRYYFMVEEEKTPVEIVVTPCDYKITVRIFVQSLPTDGSGFGADDFHDEILRQHSRLIRNPIDASQPIKVLTGNDAMKHRIEEAHSGVYIIEVLAEERDCSVRMSITTLPFADLIYPELPRDASVTSRHVSRSTVELSWKPSPSARRHGQSIDYCVVVNRRRHFRTHCAAHGVRHGDRPPTAPPDVGFRFAWQPTIGPRKQDALYRKLEENDTEITTMIPEVQTVVPDASQIDEAGDVLYECIGNRTRFIYTEVIGSGVRYYFDVFAINRDTNTSATYSGTQVVSRNEGKSVKLKDGKLVTVHLKRTVTERFFIYNLERKSPEITFQVQPCSGQLNVSIRSPRGTTIKSLKNISRLETVAVQVPQPGQYVIHVERYGRPRSTSFRIVTSADPALVPYPDLPKDVRLQTFEKLNTCDSVTVAWMGTENRQKYCLYARPETPKTTNRYQDDRCIGHADRPRSQKLSCRYFRATSERKSVVTENVRNLKPGATYEFTVYAVKKNGMSLPYENLIVKTKDNC